MKTKMCILGVSQYFDTCKGCGMPKLIKYIYLIKNSSFLCGKKHSKSFILALKIKQKQIQRLK